MYFYLYDFFLAHHKFRSILTRIENRLIDLGIHGKIERMSVLKNLKEVVEDRVKQGAETVVAVGTDAIFKKLLPIVAQEREITLGFIPMKESLIGKALGIPVGEGACDVLSARIVERIDLGKVNNHYFFSTLVTPKPEAVILESQEEKGFSIAPIENRNLLEISNFNLSPDREKTPFFSNPKDGRLEATFTPTTSTLFRKTRLDVFHRSLFPFRKMRIRSVDAPIALLVDGETLVKTPVTVEVVPRKLRLIVGKKRFF